MSELDTTVLIFTETDHERWGKEGLYVFTGAYHSTPKVPDEKQPQVNALYPLNEVLRFLGETGRVYDKDTCYISENERALYDGQEYDRKNLECFIRQGIYEFLSARMWDEDNEKDYNFARRINENHSFTTPGGDTVIIEIAFQESW